MSGLTKEQVVVLDNGQPAQLLELQAASDMRVHYAFVLLAAKNKFEQQ